MPEALVVLHGAAEAQAKIAKIDERLENMQDLFAEQFKILEEREERRFRELDGKFVRTGALKDSLTDTSASGAIRRLTNHSLEFGSSIYYAGWQVENPGPATPAGGLKRTGHPSAVMEFKIDDAQEVAAAALEFVVGSEEKAGLADVEEAIT